ncbi:MAG: DNA repair protein RadC [Bacillaceae bacterium]|nr:DNA repair protein RadC [Bacillaceae bacterium]
MTTLSLKEVPSEERPRERLIENGVERLTNTELIAILLRTGSRHLSAVALAQQVLSRSGGLRGLFDMSLGELTQLKGIGPAKAVQILAGIELGRRLSRESRTSGSPLHSPQAVADLLMEDLRYFSKEHFICLFLNTKNRVISRKTIFVGSLNASIVHPREIFKEAIRQSSASIICAHNHPSGDPTPSREDINVTKRLVKAGDIVGIDVLDHIIIGDTSYVSLKEKGYI